MIESSTRRRVNCAAHRPLSGSAAVAAIARPVYGRGVIDVLVADWQPLFRDGIARVVHQDRDLRLVLEVDDVPAARAAIRRLQPAVALVAARDEQEEAPALLRGLRRDGASTRVILLASDVSAWTWDALGLGAAGVLSRRVTPDVVRDAVRSVAQGGTALCAEAQDALARSVRERHAGESRLLSEREQQVLDLLADGLSTPAIGRRLHIATSTVRTHVKHLHEKLGTRDPKQLIREAMRRRLID